MFRSSYSTINHKSRTYLHLILLTITWCNLYKRQRRAATSLFKRMLTTVRLLYPWSFQMRIYSEQQMKILQVNWKTLKTMRILRRLFWVGNIGLIFNHRDLINKTSMLANPTDAALHRCSPECRIKCIFMNRQVQMNIAINCQREISTFTHTLLIRRTLMYLYPEIFINLTIQAEWVSIKQLQTSKIISITFLAPNKSKILHLKSYLIIRK